MTDVLLSAARLEVTITTRAGDRVLPVREATFSVGPGQTLALVGESGCGKSMTCLALAGLLPRRARITSGSATLGGVDVATLDARAMCSTALLKGQMWSLRRRP